MKFLIKYREEESWRDMMSMYDLSDTNKKKFRIKVLDNISVSVKFKRFKSSKSIPFTCRFLRYCLKAKSVIPYIPGVVK